MKRPDPDLSAAASGASNCKCLRTNGSDVGVQHFEGPKAKNKLVKAGPKKTTHHNRKTESSTRLITATMIASGLSCDIDPQLSLTYLSLPSAAVVSRLALARWVATGVQTSGRTKAPQERTGRPRRHSAAVARRTLCRECAQPRRNGQVRIGAQRRADSRRAVGK